MLQATARLSATAVAGKMPYIRTDESPNVWFEPREVWEIRGADLTISPVHKAAVGLIHPDRGISLRSAPCHMWHILYQVHTHTYAVCDLGRVALWVQEQYK